MERFRELAKREQKIDIAPLMKGEDITEWSGKEQLIREDFIWGVGPEALYQITRAEYKTEPDSIKIKDLVICRVLSTKAEHISQPRRFFLCKTNRRKNTRRVLEKTNRDRKR